MDVVNVTINGKPTEVKNGSTILQVCRENNIYIPTACYLEDLPGDAACRLCLVEVVGAKSLASSCTMPVSEGMVIYTDSEKVIEARKTVLGLLLSNHTGDCFNCKKVAECKLRSLCEEYGVDAPFFMGENVKYEIDYSNPFFDLDRNKCILCRRCVNTCSSLQCVGAIGLSDRGFGTHVTPAMEWELSQSPCESCGNCVSNCPTGALMPKKAVSLLDTDKVLTTCSYCGVGCQMYLVMKNGKIVDVKPARGTANKGLLCVKGKFAYNFVHHEDRLKTPLIKKDGQFVEATWEEAYSLITSKIKETKEKHGADAIAGFSSAKCTNEENYAFQKMMRAAIGTNNVDHCARLCHASTVFGLATTLGSGAMTNTIEEILDQDVIFVTGSNTTETHPVIGTRIRQAKKRGAKLIVADPRRIDLAIGADIFLQINPGTNIALFNGMLNIIIEEGLEDKDYIAERTENFEEIKNIIKEYTPTVVAEICGIQEDDLRAAARLYAKAERSGIYYSMGVTQFSTGAQGVMSVSNLALACGKLGKPSCGVNPLRGQNNVQGSCDMGALPTDFTGYQKVAKPEVIEKFKNAWGVDSLSQTPGLTVTEIVDNCGGKIKLLYVMGENSMLSDPDLNHVEAQLQKLDFLIVQDIFLTETAQFADVVLPAASFAEKDGTFTNTERRVQRVRKAVEPVGLAKADWEIVSEVSKRLGYENKFNSASEIMDEIASLTPSYGGIAYDRLETLSGLQWPCPTKEHSGTKYLHAEKFSREGGKATFKPTVYLEPKEVPDEDFPLVLMTGRILYQYHTRTMSGKNEGLNKIAGSAYIEINPANARKLGVNDGDGVVVSSRRGEVKAKAVVTEKVEENVTFMPFHFADGPANKLTLSAIDPQAKIPEFKVCACNVLKA